MVLRLSSQKNFARPLTHWISDSRQVWMRGGESPPSAWEATEVFGKVNSVAMLQWYGHPCVLGITIPKTLVIWASPSHITLAIWIRVGIRVTRVPTSLGFWEWGCPYHCDSELEQTRQEKEFGSDFLFSTTQLELSLLFSFPVPLLFLRFAPAENCSRSEWSKPCGHLAYAISQKHTSV